MFRHRLRHPSHPLPPWAACRAFLGYNPIEALLKPTGALDTLSPEDAAALTGKEFFPQLISGPFHDGLVVVFIAAAIMSFIGAAASLARGKKFVHEDSIAVEVEVRS